MSKSFLEQLNQVNGTRTFSNDLIRELAESCGRKYYTGSITTVSGSTSVTDSSTEFLGSDVGNYISLAAESNTTAYEITSASGVTATVTPAVNVTVNDGSYYRHNHKNLEDDLNYLRYMMEKVIGEDSWNDDPDTDLRNMAFLIPKRPNYVGETGQYTERPGTVSYAIDDINQTGYVSASITAAEYTDDTSSVSPGDSIRFTDDNTMVISITGGFYPADVGTLQITKDGVVVGTLDLATAWTNDGCSYEESEDDVGDNPDHTPTDTGTDIIHLTNRRCMNFSVDGFDDFWPGHQMASMSATLTLDAGYNGQITISHSTGGSDNYTYAEFWVDTTSQSISASAPVISPSSAVNKYLSGVPYYDTNSTFTISGTNSDTLFDRGHVSNPMTFNVGEFNESNITPSITQIGLSDPPDYDDTIAGAGGYGSVITVGGGNFRDMDARATATYRNVFTNSTSSSSSAGTYRIDTYGETSTDTVEYFDDEQYRFRGTEDFTDTTIDEGDSAWDSTDNITSVGGGGDDGLVVYNGTLKYPSIDHSTGFLPAGPDYTSQTGDFVYYRVFIGSAAFNQGSITFGGWSNALSVVQGSNVEVYLRYPNCTDYGNNNNGDVWQDLSVDQTIYGGDGCLGSGSSGSTVAFSFGTTSSVSYGNRVIMKMVFKNSSVTPLTQITFSPTV
jgi:hypothetical protein